MTDRIEQPGEGGPRTIARRTLVVAVGSTSCAIPLEHLVETMRPLPLEVVAGLPTFVRGISVIRGAPVPVVDLALIMGARDSSETSRFVLLEVSGRRVALAVDAVIGVRDIDAASLHGLPPLLMGASADLIEELGCLDEALVVVLHTGRLLTEQVSQSLDAQRTVA